MKKGLLLLLVAGAFLVSCGGGLEEQAAKDFCDCHGPAVKMAKEAGEATSATDLFAGNDEFAEALVQQGVCHKAWMKTYDGKVEIEALKEEIKKINEDVFAMAEKEKFFGE